MAAALPRWRLLGPAAVALQRSSHSVTAVASSKLYLFGGEHLSRVPVDNLVYQYDWSSSQWAPLTASGQSPRSRVGHSAASVGKWLYVFGGRAMVSATGGGKDGSKPCWEELSDLYRLDTESLAWEQLAADGEPPEARSYHAMAADDGGRGLYVFGGCGKSGRLGDLHRYDTEAGVWQRCPAPEPAIVGRGGASLAVVNGKVYVVGGFCGKEVGDVLCYDTFAQQWSVVERPLQPPRSVFAIGVRNSRIYAFGGELDPSTTGHEGAGAFYNQVEVFDPADVDAGWQKLTPTGEAPVARGWLASAMTQSGWFLHGGLDSTNQRLSDEWLLELP